MHSPEGLKKLAESMTAPLRNKLDYAGLRDYLLGSLCVKCKTPQGQHIRRKRHPFLKDNLAYLEWKYGQKKKQDRTAL